MLPNSLTPVITFLPFRMSAAILAWPRSISSASACRPTCRRSASSQQGKGNLDAWWISFPTFALLVLTLLLLTFIGDALRDALDTRKS